MQQQLKKNTTKIMIKTDIMGTIVLWYGLGMKKPKLALKFPVLAQTFSYMRSISPTGRGK